MKACEIMNDIIGEKFIAGMPWTVDKIKVGDENRKVGKIAVCHIATPRVISAAAEWGADLMITHECTFYNHEDNTDDDPLVQKKKKMLEDAGFTLYRYHDSMHFSGNDKISEGFIRCTELCGSFDGQMGFISDKAYSAKELAALIEKKLNIRHTRIVGDTDSAACGILLALGMRGSGCFRDFLKSDKYEIAVCGELCEWADCEPVRDAAEMGEHKAVIILGHADSEKFAMELLAQNIDKKYDGAAARYFDCGEIYSFTE